MTCRRIRKRIDCLSEAEREALRGAFRALMADPNPSTNYGSWVDVHARCCPHGSGCFLPWHRAYLFAFEDALRATSPEAADVTLPFWDWTTIREIPGLVTVEPLTSRRNEEANPANLPTREDITGCLNEPEFKYFGGHRCCEPDFAGDLESVHGLVHSWIGFTMTTPEAPADPVFWFHHSYVDKVWHDWYGRYRQDPPCLDAPLPGIPGNWRVGDVLRIDQKTLGYEYEDVERFALAFQFVDDQSVMRIPATAAAVVGRRRIRFDDVQPMGDGDPPAVLEIRLAAAPANPIAVVSLFGLGHHGRGHDHVGDGGHEHDHLDGGHPHHAAPAPVGGSCEPRAAGTFAAPLRVPVGTIVADEGLIVTAHWQSYSHHRAGLRVGSITVGKL